MNKKTKQNLLLFLILPIISMLLGYFGMKLYLSVATPSAKLIELSKNVDELTHVNDGENKEDPNKDTEPSGSGADNSNEEKSSVTYSFNGISVSCIQVGSFQATSSAEDFVKKLKQKGLGSYIYKGSPNRVLTEAYLSKSHAKERLEAIQMYVPDAYVVTFEIDDVDIDFDATASEVKDIKVFNENMDKTIASLDRIMVAINVDGSNEIVIDMIKSELKHFQDLKDSIKDKVNNGDASYTYKTMMDCTSRTIETYTHLIEAIEKKGQSRAVYWNGIIKTYFQYVEFLENL